MRTLLTACFAAAFALTAVAADETPLSKEMSAMNKSLRTVKRQLADTSKKEDNLALVDKVMKSIEATHTLEPKKTSEQSDKPAYTKKFQEEMLELGKTVGELKEAIKADKTDDAKAALDKIYKLKDKGHKDFGVDDD